MFCDEMAKVGAIERESICDGMFVQRRESAGRVWVVRGEVTVRE